MEVVREGGVAGDGKQRKRSDSQSIGFRNEDGTQAD